MLGKSFIFILVVALIVTLVPSWQPPKLLNQLGVCRYMECCHDIDGNDWIRYERGVEQLKEDLDSKVYGQPLITQPIYRSLMAHLRNDRPSRSLVMYFSGWTGTGKTYVARLIAKNLFKSGLNSRFVKYISSSHHFPVSIASDNEIEMQRKRLRDIIREVMSVCERSLIILDELDKLPAGVVDVLQPIFDYVGSVDGVQYNKAIFIFLSNTGASSLNALSYKIYKEGKERSDLKSKDIEAILFNDSFNEQNGLNRSSLLKRHSIGVFVPFLPLEREHVKMCIKFKMQELYGDDDSIIASSTIEEIADEMTYFPEETQMYSKSGCKGVEEKIINYLGPPKSYNLVGSREL